jgi:hypothetical protein
MPRPTVASFPSTENSSRTPNSLSKKLQNERQPTNQPRQQDSSTSTGTTNNLEASTIDLVEPSVLNLEDGFSSDVLDRILQQQMKNGGIERCQARIQEGSMARKSLEEAKRVTSGLLVGNGIHSLNNTHLLDKVKNREREVLDKEQDDARKKRAGLLTRI